MSDKLTNDDIIQIAHDWDYAYGEYQIENYVVNTGIVDYRKAKQCLVEIEQRQQSWEDVNFAIQKLEAEIEIKHEELAEETSPGRKKLLLAEIAEKENHQLRNARRLNGIDVERQRFIDQFTKFVTTHDDVQRLKDSASSEERKYWIARMGKQSAQEMLTYGKIQPGNLESIMQMPPEDQIQVISGALDYTKKMETGIISMEQEIESNLIEQLKNKVDLELIPELNNSVANDAQKLLNSTKS